ncbi:MAG: hypothetical protein LH628_01470 [Microcoleus sp. CAN_BIN18]|nr:hypothetical protein [Microcoleus sp. CAN_BIN18]
MNFTSTLLKVDIAVLSVVVSLLIVVFNLLKNLQKEALEAAKERTRIEEAIRFHDKRLNSIENWIAGNYGLRS